MAGRVYERRCDLSPDGALFACFVRKDTARAVEEIGAEMMDRREPSAVVHRSRSVGDRQHVVHGRRFPGTGTLPRRNRRPPDQGTLPAWLTLTKSPPFLDHTNDWTDRTVHFNRLIRGGWRPIPDILAPVPWWERTSPDGKRTLVMMERADGDFTSFGGRHVVEYAVRDQRGEVEDIGRATWADWDHRGRLLVARDGVGVLQSLREFTTIADFNGQTPQPESSPPVARVWPASKLERHGA